MGIYSQLSEKSWKLQKFSHLKVLPYAVYANTMYRHYKLVVPCQLKEANYIILNFIMILCEPIF